MKDPGDFILVLIFITLFLIAVLGYRSLYKEQQECHRRGGAYVKGFMGYECVVPK